jgi:hypothetical protein
MTTIMMTMAMMMMMATIMMMIRCFSIINMETLFRTLYICILSHIVISVSLLVSVFLRRQCFKHLMVFSTLVIYKILKLFKTLHVSAIGHPQVLKFFVKRIAVIFVYSCLFVPLSFVCLIPCCSFACLQTWGRPIEAETCSVLKSLKDFIRDKCWRTIKCLKHWRRTKTETSEVKWNWYYSERLQSGVNNCCA